MDFLKIDKITKNFGGVTALKDLSFVLSKGQIKSIIGPNGSGKTTLFNLISGLLRPDAGRVFFCNKDITGTEPETIAHVGIARTFQIVRPFYNMSVLENVMVGTLKRVSNIREARMKALQILELLGLEKKQRAFPGNLTIEDRKRLEFARALATAPSLLLLDEVMAGLNPSEIEFVKEVIREIRSRGITILLIEHVMEAVLSLSDEVLGLNYGEKIYDGEPGLVTKDQRVIEAYLGEEFSLENSGK
jgi:branched-chain amino acid transport system ATP-binding protein